MLLSHLALLRHHLETMPALFFPAPFPVSTSKCDLFVCSLAYCRSIIAGERLAVFVYVVRRSRNVIFSSASPLMMQLVVHWCPDYTSDCSRGLLVSLLSATIEKRNRLYSKFLVHYSKYTMYHVLWTSPAIAVSSTSAQRLHRALVQLILRVNDANNPFPKHHRQLPSTLSSDAVEVKLEVGERRAQPEHVPKVQVGERRALPVCARALPPAVCPLQPRFGAS